MKPCATCPFLPTAPTGFWHPAHYLLIAYLGSIRTFVAPEDLIFKMGCHKYNTILQPHWEGPQPRCGGWLRAARESVALQIQARMRHISAEELREMEGPSEVLSPEEMAQLNGLDLDQLPPLEWRPHDPRYPTVASWSEAIQQLRSEIRADPEAARRYVVPGSPLDQPVSLEDVERALGSAAAARYAEDHEQRKASL